MDSEVKRMSELLLLTIDSLRADHFDHNTFTECWDTFATDFARFENAMANGVATPLSFPSILTGHLATGDGTLPSKHPTLAELYEGSTWAVSNNPHLRSERNYDRGFEFFSDDPADLINEEATEASTFSEPLQKTYETVKNAIVGDGDGEPDLTPPPSSAQHVLRILRDGMDGRNGFFWAHFIDPHYQFKPQKVLDRKLAVDYSNDEILAMNERYVDGNPRSNDVEFLSRMYDELIAYLDRQLADFFDQLKAEKRWDEMTIVIAADHGEAFGERGVYNHQWDADPIDPLVRVPLLVKLPRNRHGGETYDHLVQNADIVTTLAEEFGWDIDYPPTTRPLTDAGRRTIVSKSTGAVRVTTDDGFAIRRRDGSTNVTGSIGKDAMAVLKSASIPAVEKLSGDVPGLDNEERREVEQRLEDLGYK